jgi:hypothetical protein
MSHKYKINDLVRFARVGGPAGAASSQEVFEVTRLMPLDQTGEATYRIKRTGGEASASRGGVPGEHAVRESEITPRLTSGR